VRNARHEGIEQIKKMEKGKTIPEDISHASQKEVQKVTDSFIAQVDEAFKHKETEIHAI
jgi:ribosome recycling factor